MPPDNTSCLEKKFLIKLLETPHLIDRLHPQYPNKVHRSKLWASFAKEFDMTGVQAQTKAKNYRDCYVKYMKLGKQHRYMELLELIFDPILRRSDGQRTIESCKADDEQRPDPTTTKLAIDGNSEVDDPNIPLLQKISQHPELYSHAHPQYKDTNHRRSVWRKIADEMGATENEVRERYKVIRDGFIKSQKQGRHSKYDDLCRSFIVPNSSSQLRVKCPAELRADTDNIESVNEDADLALINAVKCRPIIYNGSRCPAEKCNAIWSEIAENLKSPVVSCVSNFRRIVENHRQSKAEMRVSSNDKRLDFLDPFLNGTVNWPATTDTIEDSGYVDKTAETDHIWDSADGFGAEFTNDGIQWQEQQGESLSDTPPVSNHSLVDTCAGCDSLAIDDPLRSFFCTIYNTVRLMKRKNALVLQKQIFDLVHEMQLKETAND